MDAFDTEDLNWMISVLEPVFEDIYTDGDKELDDDLREECLRYLEDEATDDRLAGSQFDVLNTIKDALDNRKFHKVHSMIMYMMEQELHGDDTEYRVWWHRYPGLHSDYIEPLPEEMIDKAYLRYRERQGE